MKHLDGVVPDVYTKIVQVFEKGIDETISGLSFEDRSEIARFYLEYLQENCQSVNYLRTTDALLKTKGLINNAAAL